MRQRLCSNSGHHRATIAALAIKSSRGTRSVYTDRFKYVALQSRMYKRWRWGVEARRFSSRRWKIETRANLDEICARMLARHLGFWELGETRIKSVIHRILMDGFFSSSSRFLTNIKILYIFGRLDQPRFYEYVDYHVLAVEWKRNRTFKLFENIKSII